MNYICVNKHHFVHPAKLMIYFPSETTAMENLPPRVGLRSWNTSPQRTRESSCCPFCESLEYSEFVEPQPEVTNIYVHDLTSGANEALDQKLQEGYVIVGRYAKQYVLEKLRGVV